MEGEGRGRGGGGGGGQIRRRFKSGCAALSFKFFSASHPERLPSFSISSSFVLFFVLLPSFSFPKTVLIDHICHYQSAPPPPYSLFQSPSRQPFLSAETINSPKGKPSSVPIYFDIRLQSDNRSASTPSRPSLKNMQLFFFGSWRDLCHIFPENGWDQAAADVACHQLCFTGAVRFSSTSYNVKDLEEFGTTSAWLTSFQCNGQERSLSSCKSFGVAPLHSAPGDFPCVKAGLQCSGRYIEVS